MLEPMDDLRRTLFHLMQETMATCKNLLPQKEGSAMSKEVEKPVEDGPESGSDDAALRKLRAVGSPTSGPSVELF